MFAPAHAQHAPRLRQRAAWPTPPHAVLKLSYATPFECRCQPELETAARRILVRITMKTYQSVVKSIRPETSQGVTERDKCRILSRKPKSLSLLVSVECPSAVLSLRVTPMGRAARYAEGEVHPTRPILEPDPFDPRAHFCRAFQRRVQIL